MDVCFKYEISTLDKKLLRKAEGTTEIDIEKLKELEKTCFDWGYDLKDFITFFIENIDKESMEQMLSTMESIPRTEK